MKTVPAAIDARIAAIAALVLLGIALRVWQYAADTSLWLDEVALWQGVAGSTVPELLVSPLPHDQVAPKGFLLLQKLSMGVLGADDQALRAVPFLFSLVALVAFAWLALRTLHGIGPLAGVLLFAAGAPLIIGGTLFKQYSADVMAAVMLWAIAWDLVDRPVTPRRASFAALAGALLVWFSQPAVLVVAAVVALFTAWPALRPSAPDAHRRLAGVGAAWAASAFAVVLAGFASMTPATREYMRRFWAPGFPPAYPSELLSTGWPLDRITAVLGDQATPLARFGYPLPLLYLALAMAGLIVLWRRDRRLCLLLAAPPVMTVGAAVARQYPFDDRLILFLSPAFFIFTGAALESIRAHLAKRSAAAAGAAVLALVAPALAPVVATPPPYLNQHIQPVLAHVVENRTPGDAIYVYYGASPALSFYAPEYGLSRGEYQVGGCHRGDNRRYLEELDTFRGERRVWIVITHARTLFREREDILAYLDAIGSRLDSVHVASRAVGADPLPAEAFLYDLRIRGNAAHTAATFDVSDPPLPDDPLGCSEGPAAMVRSDF